jgi:hypothetical protein
VVSDVEWEGGRKKRVRKREEDKGGMIRDYRGR